MNTMTTRPIAIAEARARIRNGELKAARLRAHLTLDDIAAELGVSRSAVCRWEKGGEQPGARQPRSAVAIRWAQLIADVEAQLAGHGIEKAA